MAKRRIVSEIYSYGIYSKWDRNSKELPKLKKITNHIPLELDVEFGYILQIKGAKGKRIWYEIEHPSFKDSSGKPSPPFEGEYFINSNHYSFFLGDTIWSPISDKGGNWKLTTWLNGEIIAQKTFLVAEEK